MAARNSQPADAGCHLVGHCKDCGGVVVHNQRCGPAVAPGHLGPGGRPLAGSLSRATEDHILLRAGARAEMRQELQNPVRETAPRYDPEALARGPSGSLAQRIAGFFWHAGTCCGLFDGRGGQAELGARSRGAAPQLPLSETAPRRSTADTALMISRQRCEGYAQHGRLRMSKS